MPPRPVLMSSITRHVGSQPSSRRGHPVLIQISVRSLRSVGHPSSAASPVASSVPLVSVSSASLDLPLHVDHPPAGVVELESAAILDSTTSDFQPLPPPAPSYFPQDLFQALSPSFPDLHDWEWPPG